MSPPGADTGLDTDWEEHIGPELSNDTGRRVTAGRGTRPGH
jgi:hypothetical protein